MFMSGTSRGSVARMNWTPESGPRPPRTLPPAARLPLSMTMGRAPRIRSTKAHRDPARP
eukprot:CAMPEP_0172628336 /NCGR_PEP_ID=MMETSP1068-20121228/161173_1 /TAXON_ID=35684 /ORGANISM="Pseudopedinella elastica, Strain CCMP716" /LENGTH=58 /DNA_ID=CAMNT_0013438501 /DNA_START=65 /DNA_END=237 /DNA_ORIENTATION=+